MLGFDKEICQAASCKKIVEKCEMLRHKGDAFHAYHFKCFECGCELTSTAKVYILGFKSIIPRWNIP